MSESDLRLAEGIDLFNQEKFYECHDHIEEIWLEESSDRQPFLQGLIQAAVAFHHYQQGKLGAARSMLRLAIDKLEAYVPQYEGVPLEEFVEELRAWKEGLDRAIRGEHTLAGRRFPKLKRPDQG